MTLLSCTTKYINDTDHTVPSVYLTKCQEMEILHEGTSFEDFMHLLEINADRYIECKERHNALCDLLIGRMK